MIGNKNLLLWLVLPMIAFWGCDDDDDEDFVGNWVQLGAFEGIPRTDAVAFVINGKAYVGTGYNGEEDERLKDFWSYDPDNDYWKQVKTMPDEAMARNGAVAFEANGKGYVGTGYDGDNKLNDFWEFDPAVGDSGTWRPIKDFPGSKRYAAVAFSINDKGYVGTGYDDNRLKDFWEYDPNSDTWTQKVSVGGSKRRDAVAFVVGGKGYVCTGQDNYSYLTDVWEYDPQANAWTEKREITSDTNDDEDYDDDYNIVCGQAVAFSVGNLGYVATGGKGYAGNLTWEYNPVTDFWTEKTDFEGSSRVLSVAFAIKDIPYVATGSSSGYYFDDVWSFYPDDDEDEDD